MEFFLEASKLHYLICRSGRLDWQVLLHEEVWEREGVEGGFGSLKVARRPKRV
jgi:hypothetical protein